MRQCMHARATACELRTGAADGSTHGAGSVSAVARQTSIMWPSWSNGATCHEPKDVPVRQTP
eukprot:2317022-Pleurochrysis_carterae.AAC.1